MGAAGAGPRSDDRRGHDTGLRANNRKGNFLTNTVKAVYFLDPRPANVDFDVNIYIAAALTWATGARTSEFAFTIVITPMRTASCSEKLRHLLFTFSTRRMA